MKHDKCSFSEMRRRFLRRAALAPFLPLVQVQAAGQKEQAPVRFERVTGHRIQDEVRRAPLAILPLGSIEYHGPSGPAGTDSLIATGLAERLAARLGASLFPTIHYTHCPAHTAGFTGSLSMRPETVTAYFLDVLRGLVATGFNRILVLNGHDGNIGPARLAISQTTHDHNSAAILLVSWWETLPGPLVDSLRRLVNIRPVLAAPLWISGQLKRHAGSAALESELRHYLLPAGAFDSDQRILGQFDLVEEHLGKMCVAGEVLEVADGVQAQLPPELVVARHASLARPDDVDVAKSV